MIDTTAQLKSMNATAADNTASSNGTGNTTTATTGSASEGQPVFLAELLDDDSIIEFYEDYAELAFNNSRGKVVRKARLLKYRTQQDSADIGEGGSAGGEDNNSSPAQPQQKDPRNSILSNRVAKIDGEHGISKLERDGKLECSYTWTIKRDTFDIPMLIIINVSLLDWALWLFD